MLTAKRRWLLPTTLFLLALLPRILYPSTPITWDEPKWVNRSLRFRNALQEAEWGQTYLVGHPGVTTMWAGTVGISLNCWLRPASCLDLSLLSSPLAEQYDSEAALKQLPDLLPAAKLPAAFIIAAGVVGMYLLARRLFSPLVVLVGAILVALDPFYLAHSRVLHLDALTATFMILSLLALLVYVRDSGRWRLALSGALAALAALSKSSGLFMIPFVGVALAVLAWRRHRFSRSALLDTASAFGLWFGAAAVTWLVVWPTMWVDPVSTLQGVLATGVGYAQSPHENLNFFWGEVRADPGPAFYPVALLFRLTPLALIGLVAGLYLVGAGLWRWRRVVSAGGRQVGSLAGLLVFAVLFGVFMTVGAKKFDRYLLPAFPAVDLAAAVGLVWLAERVASLTGAAPDRQRLGKVVGLGALLSLQAISVLAYEPEYLAYYNPLLGGGSEASDVLLIGWGEGADKVARYLNAKPNASEMTVTAWIQNGFAPFFRGRTTEFHDFTAAKGDYVVFYISDVQRGFHPRAHQMFDSQEPEQVIRMHGIDYAWIYRNDHAAAVSDYLDEYARTGDAIVLTDGSVFERHYAGPLPIYTVPRLRDSDAEEVVSVLTRVAEQHRRVWFLDYGGADVIQDLVLYQLASTADPITQQSFPPYRVTLEAYDLTGASFTVTPLHILDQARFDGQLVARRLGFSPEPVDAGRPLGVTVEWQAQARMSRDYSVSFVLRDAAGHDWGKVDEYFADSDGLPTSEWQRNDTHRDWYLLQVLPGTPPGTYQVQAVVYDPVSLERLPVLGESGAPVGTEVTVGTVEVGRPATPPSLDALDIPHPREIQLTESIQLLGYGLNDDPMTPGEYRTLTLFWRATEDVTVDYDLRLRWQDDDGNTWAEATLENAFHPTSRWQEGEIVRAQYDLMLDAGAPAGQAILGLDLVQATNGQPLTGSNVELTQLQVAAPERQFTPPEQIAYPQEADLGEVVKLLGYDLDRTTVAPGETLHLMLYWQARAEMETSYTVFTHLLDAEQQIRGQKDSVPLNGAWPTTGWLPGEVVTDEYVIPVAADAPPGSYTVEVGMYEAATGARLPVRDAAGEPVPDSRILLDTAVQVR